MKGTCVPKDIADKVKTLLYNKKGDLRVRTKQEIDEGLGHIFGVKNKLELSEEQIASILRAKNEVNSLPKYSDQWGQAKVKLAGIIDDIKNPTNKLGPLDSIAYDLSKAKGEFQATQNKWVKGFIASKLIGNVVNSQAFRALKASTDLSMFLVQGFKVAIDSPSNWIESTQASLKALSQFIKSSNKGEVMDALHVKLMSDPLFDTAVQHDLRIGGLEEYFKDTFFSKVPGIKNLLKGSDLVFTVFNQTARFNIFKQQYKLLEDIARQTNTPITESSIKQIAEVANSITGSGGFGKWEKAVSGLNQVFFAPRYTKSVIDTITQPISLRLREGNQVAINRATSLAVKYIGGLGATLTTLWALAPDRVVLDPKSPKFGKFRVSDDRWISFGGPIPSYITLISRLLMGETSNAKGKVTELNSGKYGSSNRLDVATRFAVNKLAPVPSVVAQAWLTGTNYMGKPYTIKDVPDSLLTPITLGNIVQMAQTQPDVLQAVLAGLEVVGVPTNNYNSNANDANLPIKYLINKVTK